jgi:hypothetical protein
MIDICAMTRLTQLLFCFASMISSFVVGQTKKPELIQFSGVVVSIDSLEQLPYTSVFDKSSRRGTTADYNGYFSFVVKPGDTIVFNHFGYKPSTYVVADTLSESRYSLIHAMTPDTISIPDVVVYPWPSREQFARAFIEMDPYDDALRRAQRQLSGESISSLAQNLPNDASLAYSWQVQQAQNQVYSRGQAQTTGLLNPIQWAQFIDAWKKGKLKKQ